ncbi:MAG: hypothetical protein ACQCN5_01835 [Candidatus Bathyarchaeia archaeon]
MKQQQQFYTLQPLKRCTYRTNHIAWCRKLQKFCDAPAEYRRCTKYQPKMELPNMGKY